jgi:hypothetical protein
MGAPMHYEQTVCTRRIPGCTGTLLANSQVAPHPRVHRYTMSKQSTRGLLANFSARTWLVLLVTSHS